MNKKECGRPPKFVIALCVLAALFLFSAIVMLLWNAILPSVFNNVGMLTYWQAMGILILSKILFGGFNGRKKFGPGSGGFRDKFKSMTPDEREQFKDAWRRRCARFSGKEKTIS